MAFVGPCSVFLRGYQRAPLISPRRSVNIQSHPCRVRAAMEPEVSSQTTDAPSPLLPESDSVWEMDFYSRPVVGSDGKKLWELIITDSEGSFEHVESVPNSRVNSRELRKRIRAVIAEFPSPPSAIRFFRSQMFNMISIALSDLKVEAVPSRRTYALFRVIRGREQNVYPKMRGYKKAAVSSSLDLADLDFATSKRLPDALRCDTFAFAKFPLQDIEDFFKEAEEGTFFGSSCYVEDEADRESAIPGLVLFSSRAGTLSAMMAGAELAYVRVSTRAEVIALECGISTSYEFAKVGDAIRSGATDFQSSKEAAGGLHFVAVKKDQQSEEVDGFWLLCDAPA